MISVQVNQLQFRIDQNLHTQKSSSDYYKSNRNKEQYDRLLLTIKLDQDMT